MSSKFVSYAIVFFVVLVITGVIIVLPVLKTGMDAVHALPF